MMIQNLFYESLAKLPVVEKPVVGHDLLGPVVWAQQSILYDILLFQTFCMRMIKIKSIKI